MSNRRLDVTEQFLREVHEAFAFLVQEAGFAGPEPVEHGVRFRRPGLRIEVWFLGGREPGVTTLLDRLGADGRLDHAWLHCLYVAAGCGPPQHVPETVPTRRAVLKRVHEHAAALRRLLPSLVEPGMAQLFARCACGAELPDDWRYGPGGGPDHVG